MQQPLQVSFHDIEPSEAVTEYVKKRAAKLDRVCDRIQTCRVVLEAPHRSQRHGNGFRVRVRVAVPRGEVVVGDHTLKGAGDLFASIDAAFDETARALEAHVRKHRIETGEPRRADRGRVVKLFSYEGYGFLENEDGIDVYFHKNSVLNGGFDRLRLGQEVRYVEELGERGPQASTVVARHHASPSPAASEPPTAEHAAVPSATATIPEGDTHMKASELMTAPVRTCSLDDDLSVPAMIMWERDCGCVPVVDGEGRVVSMITDRDIAMASLLQGRPLHQMRVRSVTTGSLVSVAPETTITDVERAMTSAQVRRVPVIDGDGRALGVVSLSDLARGMATHSGNSLGATPIANTLAQVSRPRAPRTSANGHAQQTGR